MSEKLVEAVDRAADRTGQTRSAMIRELVTQAMRDRDEWPPSRGRGESQ